MKARVAKTPIQQIDAAHRVTSGSGLQHLIAEAAYYRAERRGFVPGQEVEDWLAAEKEVMERASVSTPPG